MAEKKENRKLTYEQLEAYAQQTVEQAKKIYKENQMLKQALNRANLDNNFREIECALKCLDHADMFSTEFIQAIVKRLEEVLNPTRSEDEEEAEPQKEEE